MEQPRRAPGLRSRAVRLGTVVLPVAALLLLSTIFLLARRVNPDDAFPLATVDVSERARDRQLTGPRFTGISREGTAFALSADRARPDADDPRRMTAQAVRLVLDGSGGGRADIVAATGRVDTAGRAVTLDGDVRIVTSTGYDLETDRLSGSLERMEVIAPQQVRGTGPLGTLSAGGMRIDEDAAGAPRLVFTGGVVLLYLPPT